MVSAVSHRARYKDDGHKSERTPLPSPDPTETMENDPAEYDAIDEAAMESFPASDAPAFPGRETKDSTG